MTFFSRTRVGVAIVGLIALSLVCLAGCGATDPDSPEPTAATPTSSTQSGTPEDAVRALMAAIDDRDWSLAYSLYASPAVSRDVWLKECTEADETYEDFVIHETTLSNEDLALVRVSYKVETGPPGGERHTVVVPAPGEDWRVEKVDGVWKVGWLPRQ
jgi:hypothetical protein